MKDTSVNRILNIEWQKKKKSLILKSIARLQTEISDLIEKIVKALSLLNHIKVVEDHPLDMREKVYYSKEQGREKQEEEGPNENKINSLKVLDILSKLKTYHRRKQASGRSEEGRILDSKKCLQMEFSFFLVYFTASVILMCTKTIDTSFDYESEKNNMIFILHETLVANLKEEIRFLSTLQNSKSNIDDCLKLENDSKSILSQSVGRCIQDTSHISKKEKKSHGKHDFTYDNLEALANLSKSSIGTLQNLYNEGKLLHLHNIWHLHEFYMKDRQIIKKGENSEGDSNLFHSSPPSSCFFSQPKTNK